jgi:hypothetical protein
MDRTYALSCIHQNAGVRSLLGLQPRISRAQVEEQTTADFLRGHPALVQVAHAADADAEVLRSSLDLGPTATLPDALGDLLS